MIGLILALAWIGGVATGLLPFDLGWAAPLLAGAALVGAWLAGSGSARVVALAMAFGLLGLWRASVAIGSGNADPLAGLNGDVTLVGRVADAPTLRGSRLIFPIEVRRVERPRPARDVDAGTGATVLVRAAGIDMEYGDVEYGDVVEVWGRLAEPRSRPGYPEAELLARRGITRVIDFAGVRPREKAEAGPAVLLARWRGALEGGLRSSLPEPHASLAAGIVLGARSGTPPELRSALVATGTNHIVAVSGFNVLIVAGTLGYVVIRLIGRPWALAPMLLTVWAYTLLVGAPPSAVRAALMVSFALLAQAVGRLPDPITTLTITAAVMVGWDPRLLVDVGFQLSVAATAGLILLVQPLAERLLALPRLVRESLAVGIAAQLATLPIILGTFHALSLVAPIANLLVSPVVPAVMLFGSLLAVLGPLPGLGELLAWTTYGLVSWLLVCIEWAANLPSAVLFTGRLPSWFSPLWYGLLALWAAAGSADVRALSGHRPALRVGLGAAVALVPATAILAAPSSDTAVVSILDVGAPAAFVRAPSGRSVLLGGGASASQLSASVAERLALWERGLDLVVATRGADPERTALVETLRKYPARLSLSAASMDDGVVQSPSSRADGADVSGEVTLEPGQVIDLGDGARIEVVDVRTYGEQTAIDLQIVVGDVAVWLPSAGPPSSRWHEVAAAHRRVIARVPIGAVGWLRAAPRAQWLAIVTDSPARLPPEQVGAALILDHRTYGDVDAVVDAGGVSLRTTRCPVGRSCSLALPPNDQVRPDQR